MWKDRSHFTLSPAEYEAARSGHLEHRRFELIHDALMRYRATARSVLEIGFGTGNLLAALGRDFPTVHFEGLEVEPNMVAYAEREHKEPNIEYRLGDIQRLLPKRSYDFVFSIDVIHHIHDHTGFFSAVHGSLNEDGIWYVIEPNIFHPYIYYQQERMRRSGLDEDHFRPWQLEPLLKGTGFIIIDCHYAFLFPGWIRNLPGTLARLEKLLERNRFLGASTIYALKTAITKR